MNSSILVKILNIRTGLKVFENVKFVRYKGKGSNFDRRNEVNEIKIVTLEN